MPLLVLGCAALAIRAGTKKVDHWVPRILEDLRSPKPIAAFVLSLLIPGIAQMRQDRFFLGLVLFVVLTQFLNPVFRNPDLVACSGILIQQNSVNPPLMNWRI